MNPISLETLEISTAEQPDASIIWLHGLGADGHDFAPIVRELELPIPVRFVLPHAPLLPVTINGGHRMPAWYDIVAMEITAKQDASGIRKSQERIEGLIAREKQRGIAPERILLAGFSQGGAIALHTALRHVDRLGGVLALSTYLPLQATLEAERHQANLNLPIYMGHGRQDSVISMEAAAQSRDTLLAYGYPLSWHAYDMPHSVCRDEIEDIRDFILRVLSQRPTGV